MYQYDGSYAWRCSAPIPPLAIVKPVDPDNPAVADVVATGRRRRAGRHPHHADEGKRTRPDHPASTGSRGGGSLTTFRSTSVLGQSGRRPALIDRHPDTRFIIDHIGILQPRTRLPAAPWVRPPKVLELASARTR